MLSVDRYGDLTFGEHVPSIAKDISIRVLPDPARPGEVKTVYQFVLKQNLYFSDGTLLTINDVLFNLYVLLDPNYMGNITLNSVDIEGLWQYRMQMPFANEDAYQVFRRGFYLQARMYVQQAIQYLQNHHSTSNDRIRQVFDIAIPQFDIELLNTWNASVGQTQEMRDQFFYINYDWEMFFINLGILDFSRDTLGRMYRHNGFYRLDVLPRNSLLNIFSDNFDNVFNKQNAIALARSVFIVANGVPRPSFAGILNWHTTGDATIQILAGILIDEHFSAANQQKTVYNISGIRALTGAYFVPSGRGVDSAMTSHSYDTGRVFNASYEMLQITIHNVDPSAIHKFNVAIAPMHFYSTPLLTAAAVHDTNFERHFGVAFANIHFMHTHLRSLDRTPMGAGPYRFKDFEGGIAGFERNSYFMLGAPNIRYVHKRVVTPNDVMTLLVNGDIHFADPSATDHNRRDVRNHRNLNYQVIRTNGYGYVGVSARHTPYLGIRRAIMSAMDVTLANAYFPHGLSEPLHRGMSHESWVWGNRETDPWSIARNVSHFTPGVPPGLSGNPQRLAIVNHHLQSTICPVKGSLARGADGMWRWNSGSGAVATQFTFEVAGNSTDHPAFTMFLHAAALLNQNGWNVTVRPNAATLRELVAGRGRPVWAAAWSSGVDPDMYALWHPNSTAAAMRNWGIDGIVNGEFGCLEQQHIVGRIEYFIDLSRSTLDRTVRRGHIRNALDYAMELAVELPTYNRSDMFVWNYAIIDSATLNLVYATAFANPLAYIWNISFHANLVFN